MESRMWTVSLNFIDMWCCMVLLNLTLMTADLISTRGIVVFFKGVTLDLAAKRTHSYPPDSSSHLTWAVQHIASLEPSLHMMRIGSPMAPLGRMHRGNRTDSAVFSNWSILIHSAFSSWIMGSSHPRFSSLLNKYRNAILSWMSNAIRPYMS